MNETNEKANNLRARIKLVLSLIGLFALLIFGQNCTQKSNLQGILGGSNGLSSSGTPPPVSTPVPTPNPTPSSTPTQTPKPTPVPTPTPTPVQATGNILTNGDFSKGLACYGGYEWSNNYDFLISSTDYRSAPYAAELYCGSGCNEAIIDSGQIPFTAGKSYTLQVYTKCQAGVSGSVYIPNTTASGGTTSQAVTCDGKWDLTQLTFTPAAGNTYISFSIYNKGKGSLLIDDIVLTYSDGTTPGAAAWKHPGARNVTWNTSTVSVDGSPYLALGFLGVPWANLSTVASMGANTIAGDTPTATDCFEIAGEDILDQAYELGLNVLPNSTTAARASLDNGTLGANGSGGVGSLSSVASRYAPHLANIGWFLVDEPDQAAVSWYLISPPTLVSEAAAVRTQTTLPTLVDFQHADNTQSPTSSAYDGSADIWMAEPYGTNFTNVVTAINTLEAIHKRPIWLFNNDITSTSIVPKAYFDIVNGATGIFYFNYESFLTDPAGMAAVQQAFTELGSLKGAIFGSSVTVTPPTGVSALGRSYNGSNYILSANPTSAVVTGSFSVPGLASGKTITVQFENRTITSTSGAFSDTFSGVTRHVYIY